MAMLGSRALVRAPLSSAAKLPWEAAKSRQEQFLRCPSPRLSFLRCHSSEAALAAEPIEDFSCRDTVEELLTKSERIKGLMKMERREAEDMARGRRWFPYLDEYKAAKGTVSSREIVELIDPHIMESRKARMKRAVAGRSYSICLVIEGVTDFGNVSAAFRSADALGIQSVHVVSNLKNRRYRDNRHVSMGAEKWLDIEMWSSSADCFKVLKSRGYRVATTHLGSGTESIYDMDWSMPTAIVIGNEQMGLSKEALECSDLHCAIPMNGMVDSFNVSVAAGILMHHAVYDKVSRLGYHGDLSTTEREILLAEFFLRHRENTVDVVEQYARQRRGPSISRM
ncbi:tRNA/rRNA methyltransferase (SpoU) family protein [Wolffia australiana]